MKRLYPLFLLLLMLCLMLTAACADTISIDLDAASYEEIVAAYELLKAERLQRLGESFAASHEIQSSAGIEFRNVPWGSTKKEAEAMLGVPIDIPPDPCARFLRRFGPWIMAHHLRIRKDLVQNIEILLGQFPQDQSLGFKAHIIASRSKWRIGRSPHENVSPK